MLRRTIALLAMAASTAAVAQSDAPPRVVVPDKLAGYWALVNASVEADVPIMRSRANTASKPGSTRASPPMLRRSTVRGSGSASTCPRISSRCSGPSVRSASATMR